MHGFTGEDVKKDLEVLQTMRNLALRLLGMEIRRKKMKKDDNTHTEYQYHGKAIILHYNDDNKDEVFKQIYDSEKPVHVIVDEGVTDIVVDAFCGCDNLASIEIPGSVTSIGYGAFFGCYNLTSIKVTKNNPIYDSRNDCNAIIKTETNTLIIGCEGTKIPGSITSIGYGAFSGCYSLTGIEIPKSVTSIGDDAFSTCDSLTDIEIPESVTSIGDYAFLQCNSLTSIEIPESVTSIGKRAFDDCSSLKSIIWHDKTYDSEDEFIKAFEAR